MTLSRAIDPVVFVRPELRRLAAYHLDLRPARHKLDQNEVPWDLPVRLKRKIAGQLLQSGWARYPDFHADALRQALGRLHGHPWEGVLVGNGSNELLSVTLTALVPPGGEVIGVEPSFGLYRSFVLKAAGVPKFLPAREDLRLQADEIEAEIERNPRRPLLLCTPNNPTGDALPPDRIAYYLERLQAPLLLDNAYGEFCRWDYRPLLARFPHLILFRTFSKAWSLAGLRLGYLMADPRLVAELIKVKLPYNLSHAGAIAGRVVLEEREEEERRVRVIVARRAQWARMLTEEGLETFPSEANFLLVRCATLEQTAEIRDGLAARGILIRDVSGYAGLARCLRVSIGSGAALRDFHLALAEIRDGVAVERSRFREMPPARPHPPAPSPIAHPSTGRGGDWSGKGRIGSVERSTGETRIRLRLSLDGGARRIEVPNGFLGHMLTALATHGGFGLEVEASGDTHVDLHHTVEDVGIAFGEALALALGERRGIVRFGSSYAPLDEALARAVVDLSGRGIFAWSAPPEVAAGWVTADFPLTLVADFFQAVADRGRLTLHLDVLSARNGHHAAEAAFKAVALALRQAVALRSGAAEVPSTKGTLSA
ncbi:MAG TPA: aminotransferase class I/II-fold pyridoxal phosphate-dependent enzyme [Thermoanaerobaculia bacterium]|nr:aminotransferase class I/II-fold pyridoxal phosphate-dependent enzyme [Thermoanaerobaculia bacterium]